MSSLYPLQRKVTERAPKVSQELAANLLGVVLSWGITYAGYRAFLALLELGSGSATIFQSGVGEACAKALAEGRISESRARRIHLARLHTAWLAQKRTKYLTLLKQFERIEGH